VVYFRQIATIHQELFMPASFALCVLTLLAPAAGPPSAHPWAIEFGQTGDQLTARAADLRSAGYRPICVSGYNVTEAVRFATIWEKAKGPTWTLEYGITPPQLNNRAREEKKAGFRPIGLSGYDLAGTQGFIDLWEKATGPAWQVEYGLDAPGLRRVITAMKGKGYRPRNVSSYVSATFSRYALIWEKGGDVTWDLRWGMSAAGLDNALKDLGTGGYRPVAIAGMGIEEQVLFTAIWEKRKGPEWTAHTNLDGNGLKTLAITMRNRGYRPTYLAGYGTLNGVRFASIWEKAER
jgi:hypothetical protein